MAHRLLVSEIDLCTMKKLLLTFSLASFSLFASAQSSRFGLGIMLGEPTGISAKYWISGENALDFGLAWGGLGREGGYLHLHGDYLFHNFSLINVSSGKLPLYFGPGLRLRSWSGDSYWNNGRRYDSPNGHTRVGIRFPVGLAYLFDGAPVDVFLEVVPTLDLIPSTSFDIDAALGVRYWFGR
jgi:hypothetical protein